MQHLKQEHDFRAPDFKTAGFPLEELASVFSEVEDVVELVKAGYFIVEEDL